MFALLLACLDYGFGVPSDPQKPLGDGPRDDTGGPPGTGDTSSAPHVDPTDCDLDVLAAGPTDLDPACQPFEPGAISDPWDVVLEWSSGVGREAIASAAVGQLTDDNADGVIDLLDTPDVAWTDFATGDVEIASGDGSGVICTASGFLAEGGIAIADVTGDGVNEVVGPTASDRIRAIDGRCHEVWSSEQAYTGLYSYTGLYWPVTTVADLEGDGTTEVIVDVAVVDGRDGAHIAWLAPQHAWCLRSPVAGDIDGDGEAEVLLGNSVFDARGALLWSIPGTSFSEACHSALANLDADDDAEIVLSYGNTVYALDPDGSVLWGTRASGWRPGPPCVGDLDGDGEPEIVAPSTDALIALDHDGRLLWEVSAVDASGTAGCSVFDVDANGRYEVLYADEASMRIIDGRTGDTLFEDLGHNSYTGLETPVVADVDGDGSAEIVVVNGWGSSRAALTVWGHASSGWAPAGPTWGLHDFSEANQLASGGIPRAPRPWLYPELFRGRPPLVHDGAPELTVLINDTCVTTCEDGVVDVAWQVSNVGGASVDGDCEVELLVIDRSGHATVYDRVSVPVPAAGRAGTGGVFRIPTSQLEGGGLRVSVDAMGRFDECHDGPSDSVTVPDPCP